MRPIAYTVHGPLPEIELVAERFSLAAFLFGPLWLLAHAAWVEAILWLGFVGAGIAAGLFLLPERPLPELTVLAAALFTGFEAGEIRRRVLARQGHPVIGVVTGESRADAEDRVVLKVRS